MDGLRGLAVLAVLLYHAQLGCPGGYVGVDIFFVISGYLICRLLELEIGSGTFSYFTFWMRRIRRLLPSLMVMIFFTVLASFWLLTPDDLEQLGLATAAQPLLAVNLVFWRTVQTGYFGEQPEIRPTLHTWSLAVEEQFYLFCPLVLWLLRRAPGSRRAAVYATVFLASWMASGILTASKPVLSYFLLPTRVFEILLGGMLWYVPEPSARQSRELLCSLGFLLIGFSVFGFSDQTIFPGWVAIFPCLGSALLLQNSFDGFARGFLASRILTGLGRISYSLYLWHWPLIALWRYAQLPWGIPQRVGLIVVSLALGAATTTWVENPIRARKLLGSDRQLLVLAWVSGFSCLFAGGLIVWRGGFPSRFSATALGYFRAKDDRSFVRELTLDQFREQGWVEFGAKAVDQVDLFVWGDSHAMAVLGGLDELLRKRGLSGRAATRSGSPPFFCERRGEPNFDSREQAERVRLVHDFLRVKRPRAVLLVARWDYYAQEDYIGGLTDTVRFLDANKIPCWLMLQVPHQEFDVPKMLGRLEHLGRDLKMVGLPLQLHRQKTSAFSHWLEQSGFPKNRVLDPAVVLANKEGICRTSLEQKSLYYDRDHLSVTGSRLLEALYPPLIQSLK